MADELNLHTLTPAQARKDRKRVGRGLGSGKGRYSGRGIKGQKSRAGSKKMAAGFEGGQMPIDMRMPKLRGNTSADAMPIGPFRTYSQPINLRDLDRVFADGDTVNIETLVEKGLLKNTKADVKILGTGDLSKKLVGDRALLLRHRAREDHCGRRQRHGAQGAEGPRRRRARRSRSRPPTRTEPEVEETEAEAPAEESEGVFSWLANAWRVPELRHRVLFTALILAIYRLGSWIPAPGVDSETINNYFEGQGGTILGLLNLFSGGALSQFSIFALGIMPFVTASIILQLMTVVIPRLAELQKEGESGYAKINQYTRYLTVVLAAAQATGYAFLFKRQGALDADVGRLTLIILSITVGCVLLMWMGELITKRGIGNGISLLIFASILVGAPIGIPAWWTGGPMEKLFFPLIALSIIAAIVFIQEGQRRIPIQYAKRMVGRRMTAGGSTYMPLRVNMAGVIPVIFAAAVMAFPPTIGQYFPQTQEFVNEHFLPTNISYMLLQGVLIVIFTYFYTAVQFNPVDQADNLRRYGGYIPGIRPGPPTAQYLDRVLTRLTLPGAIYLALVATLPTLFIRYGGFSQATAGALGGTSVLIAVGVALDTMRQMESQMMMRSYEGFLK